MTTYNQTDKTGITELLMGRKVTKVADDTLLLDDGRKLRFIGHDGGCACPSGCYDLTELNDLGDRDNIITAVEFLDSPKGDDDANHYGHYRIFVFADNQVVNLATFVGTDGNGYYGTGYSITVEAADEPDGSQ